MRISDWSSDVCSSDLNGRHYRDGYGRNGRLFLSAIRFKAQPSVTKPEPCGAGKICESLTLPHWSQQEMPERACQRAPGTAMSRFQERLDRKSTRLHYSH